MEVEHCNPSQHSRFSCSSKHGQSDFEGCDAKEIEQYVLPQVDQQLYNASDSGYQAGSLESGPHDVHFPTQRAE